MVFVRKMGVHSSRSIPELAACISKEIEKTYITCTVEQQDFILKVFNRENRCHLQNMDGELNDWLRNKDPIVVVQHFKRLRGLILMAQEAVNLTAELSEKYNGNK